MRAKSPAPGGERDATAETGGRLLRELEDASDARGGVLDLERVITFEELVGGSLAQNGVEETLERLQKGKNRWGERVG